MLPSLALSLLLGVGGLWPPGQDSFAAELARMEPGRRLAAIVRVAAAGRPDDLRRLVPLLDHGDTSVRLTAARALVRAGDPTAIERASQRAADQSPAVRFEALTLLRDAAVLSPQGRRATERALGDADPAARMVALETLAAHPDGASVPVVAGALADGNRDVRLAAVRLLGLSGDGRAVLPLLERIDAQDRVERVAVIDALAAIGPRPPLDAAPALLRQLDDSNEDVRVAAVEALARMRAGRAVPKLRALAARQPRENLGRRSILALGAIADPPAVTALIELLREPAPASEVGEALRRAGRPAAKAVAAVLPDAHPLSAAMAAGVLAGIGDSAATAALAAVMQKRPTVALAIAQALGELGDPAAVPVLSAVLADPRFAAAAGVREACLTALAAIGDRRAVAVVETAARDGDPDVRIAALRLAAVLHGGLSRKTLAARLTDGDKAVRDAALAAAAELPALHPAPLLIDALVTASRSRGADDDARVADTLEAVVLPADEPMLWTAWGGATGAKRVLLLRALAAARPSGAALSAALEAAVLEVVDGGGAAALAAADVLAAASLRERTVAFLRQRFSRWDPPTRARVVPALAVAGTPAADAALTAILDGDPDEGVRAAAAWAARGRRAVPPVAAALERARGSATARLVGNTTAAVAASGPGDWVRVRVYGPGGVPARRRWIRIRAGGLTIWTLTDPWGEARVAGLPPGGYWMSSR